MNRPLSTMENTVTTASNNKISTPIGISFIAAVAVIMFNALPAFVGAAAESMAFSNTQLGSLVSSYFIGHTLMTIFAGFGLRRLNLRSAALVASLLTGTCFLALTIVSNYQIMLAILLIAGLGGGSLFVFAMSVMALSDRPTRNLGLCYLMQMIVAAIVVYFGPGIITPAFGLPGIVLLFACLMYLTIALDGIFSRPEVIEAVMSQPEEKSGLPFQFRPTLTLVVLTFFTLNFSAIWSFIERIGDAEGFGAESIGLILMTSLAAGAIACWLTMVLENRFGLRLPIGICCTIGTLFLLLLASNESPSLMIYAIAVIGFQFCAVMTTNYISASVAHLDTNGAHAPLIPAALGLGVILGPSIGGMLSEAGYLPLFILGIGLCLFTAAILAVSPLLKGAH